MNYTEEIEKIIEYEQDWASCDFYAPEGERQYQDGKSLQDLKSLMRELIKECVGKMDEQIHGKYLDDWKYPRAKTRNDLRSEILSKADTLIGDR